MYRQERNYENLQKFIFDGTGPFNIPELKPDDCDVEHWISFNFAKTCEEPELHGVHFFSSTITSLTGYGQTLTNTSPN